MEMECRWNSNANGIPILNKERGNHRKFVGVMFTWIMKPPHYLTQKCQKLSQFASSWTLASEATLNDSHQQ
jgi:hypothetical protein